ncbi:MAG TPA: hypothetical protein VHM24_13820 [Gemmatimonadaceae bacterium]|nr:hypothetical protein [Gemmatimonadaceae bacterium]
MVLDGSTAQSNDGLIAQAVITLESGVLLNKLLGGVDGLLGSGDCLLNHARRDAADALGDRFCAFSYANFASA